jgi:serine kinase of HPr protein (carbohydrate metabolism regulator)
MPERPTVHACAVLVGARALLIRGPSGSGKSRLALRLIAAAQSGLLPFARLVADDRIRLEPCHGRLLVHAPDTLAGLIEVRGLGIRQLPYEPVAVVGGVVDLATPDAQRLPEPAEVEVEGIRLPQLRIAKDQDAYPSLMAWLTTESQTGAWLQKSNHVAASSCLFLLLPSGR